MPVRVNGRGVVTVPFNVVGEERPDLGAILDALSQRARLDGKVKR